MSKFTKSITSALAILSLSFTGLSAAKADETPTLTFEEFMAGPAYQDYVAANVANSAFLKIQSGLTMDVSVGLAYSQEAPPVTTTMKIETDMSNARISMATGDQTMDIVIIGNTAYSTLSTYNSYFGPENRTKVFSRIGNTSGKSIKMREIPDEVAEFAPSNFISDPSALQNQIVQSQLSSFGSGLKFTEMIKSVNPDDESMTDYSFSIGIDFQGSVIRVDMISTFDSNSMLVKTVSDLSGASEAFTMVMNTVITTSVTPDIVINAPTSIIDENTIIRTSNQLIAEGKSTAKASAITKKAAELAKKAKKPVSATYLQAAAKSLKYTVTKLSNGVKLTSTVSGVKGSLCVTAYKGKTSTKNC